MADKFDFGLFGLPQTITHEWTYATNEGPLTTDIDGRPMRVNLIQVILDGKKLPVDIKVRGQRARQDGSHDRRCFYPVSEPYDGRIHQGIAEHFGSLRRTGQL